jgi:hypothetical protein
MISSSGVVIGLRYSILAAFGTRGIVSFETTAVRIWKRLTRDERVVAATAFWNEPPEIALGSALGAIVKARHVRPQVARSMPLEARAQALASVLDPGEAVASSLLVALHLVDRRPLLCTFLDAAGLPHENGLLKEKEDELAPPLPEAAARAGVKALAAAHPSAHVETYLNVLWLQDPERWAALARSPEWLQASG